MEWAEGEVNGLERALAVRPRVSDVCMLLDLYEVGDEDTREALFALTREARQRGWWTAYGALDDILLSPVLKYPLFDAALERYGRHPADPADLARRLTRFGLRAEVSTAGFRLAIRKDEWLAMVASRWMSLLSKFDDAELAAGIAQIDARYGGPVLEFDDTFVFVLARRPGEHVASVRSGI
jgi:hypothetical protein